MRASVCILGGGPAGSTLAARMALLGHDVCLVERAAFPRRRLGESLSPGVLPMLAMTGAHAAVDRAAFTRVRTVRVTWDDGPRERADPGEQGLLVDRGVFDQILLDRARDLGVRVLQPAEVVSRKRSPDGWTIRINAAGRCVHVSARFLADATGRAGALRGVRQITGPRTVVLHGYWRGASIPAEPSIEAGESAWYWGVPLPDGSYNTLAFLDAARLRGETRATLAQRFHELIAHSHLMDGCRDVRLVTPVLAADATPYVRTESVTDDTIAVGDAALAIDPLSSSGVQKAVQSALSAALVLNTLIRRPELRDAASAFYASSLSDASERHRRWARGHYALVAQRRPDRFWSDRAAGAESTPPLDELTALPPPTTRLSVSPDVEFVDLPCAGSEFICVRPALRHPAVEGPLAFLGGVLVAPLLRTFRPGTIADDAATTWSEHVPLGRARSLVAWLVSHGLLIPT